jgi:hypothetical protein
VTPTDAEAAEEAQERRQRLEQQHLELRLAVHHDIDLSPPEDGEGRPQLWEQPGYLRQPAPLELKDEPF